MKCGAVQRAKHVRVRSAYLAEVCGCVAGGVPFFRKGSDAYHKPLFLFQARRRTQQRSGIVVRKHANVQCTEARGRLQSIGSPLHRALLFMRLRYRHPHFNTELISHRLRGRQERNCARAAAQKANPYPPHISTQLKAQPPDLIQLTSMAPQPAICAAIASSASAALLPSGPPA